VLQNLFLFFGYHSIHLKIFARKNLAGLFGGASYFLM
jgi:hypothetical protein